MYSSLAAPGQSVIGHPANLCGELNSLGELILILIGLILFDRCDYGSGALNPGFFAIYRGSRILLIQIIIIYNANHRHIAIISPSHRCHIAVTLLSHHRHTTVTPPLHHHHITVTSPSHHRHITITSTSHHRQINVTSLSFVKRPSA